MGLLIDKKQKRKCQMLTERARLKHTPRNSLKRLAQETGMSSARRATQLLKLRSYKTTVIHAPLAAAQPS
jgi:hypothetical protein